MRKASDFLSKPVISLKEGKNEGIIKNISFDAKLTAAEWLVLYDENDADCDEKAIKLDGGHILGENAVMIKSGKAVVPAVSAPLNDNNPINCRIYTAAGKFAGIVSDVVMTDGNAVIEFIYNKDKALPLRDVLSGSRDVVVSSAGGGVSAEALELPEKKVPAPKPADKKRKVKALKPKEEKPVIIEKDNDNLKKEIKETIAEIMAAPEPFKKKDDLGVAVPFRAPQPAAGVSPAIPALLSLALIKTASHVSVANEQYAEQPYEITGHAKGHGDMIHDTQGREPCPRDPYENPEFLSQEFEHIPERIIACYGFLLGRKVGKNIYNSSRQIIIKADTVVSAQTVETARKYGRLIDLTKLSL